MVANYGNGSIRKNGAFDFCRYCNRIRTINCNNSGGHSETLISPCDDQDVTFDETISGFG